MYSTSTSTVQYRVYKFLLFLGSVKFYLGGLHTVQYRVYHYFLLGSILFGGLKPPSPNDAPPLGKAKNSNSYNVILNTLLITVPQNTVAEI